MVNLPDELIQRLCRHSDGAAVAARPRSDVAECAGAFPPTFIVEKRGAEIDG
jgi:hypothetical protein